MGHYCVLALHTLVYFQAGEFIDIHLVFRIKCYPGHTKD